MTGSMSAAQAMATGMNSNSLTVETPPEQTFGLNYDYSQTRISALMQTWDFESINTDYRRRTRDIVVNVNDLRNQGHLKPDETLIPVRLINTNIEREKPPYVAFMTQSQRRAVFKAKDDIKLNTPLIEEEFTRVTSYLGWELSHYRCLDGSQTHGWDAVEIEFDPTLPSKHFVSHIGHDNLCFPLDARDIEDSEFILVRKYPTVSKLRQFVFRHGFNKDQVNKVIQKSNISPTPGQYSDVPQDDSTRDIYKVFFKSNGIVYVAWYGGTVCDAWLVEPKPLYMGVQVQKPQTIEEIVNVPVVDPLTGMTISVPTPQPRTELVWEDEPEVEYPVVLLFYSEGEQQKIADKKGRVYLDESKQEAAIGLTSAFVNTAQRSSNLQAFPDGPNDESGSPKQTGVILGNGTIWNRKMGFFNTPPPSPAILQGIERIAVQNSQEALQVDYTVKNRQDSRKTATEIQSAEADQALINGVQVTLFSIYLRKVYTKIWHIIQSQALQEKIKFCQLVVGQELDGKPIFKNNTLLLNNAFEVFAAGDVDVVQRQQKLSMMMNMWPVVSQTPIAQMFLLDILKLAFPSDIDKYTQAWQQAQMMMAQNPQLQNQNQSANKENSNQPKESSQ